MIMELIQFFKYYRYREIILITFISLLFFLIYFLLKPPSEIKFECIKVMENESSCIFNCTIDVKECRNMVGRIIVTHSGWAAIYDKVFNLTCPNYYEIELPKRNYNYVIRSGIYGKKVFGTAEEIIFC